MIFSDKDVKRLKEAIGDGYGWWHEQLKTTGLQALLSRLEAAEKLAVTMEETARYNDCDFCIATESDEGELHYVHFEDCPLRATIEAWRKACGK